MSELDPDALDRYLTGGRYSKTEILVWCQNPACLTFGDMPVEVLSETEYGTTWWTPDECPLCDGELGEDQPEKEGDSDT